MQRGTGGGAAGAVEVPAGEGRRSPARGGVAYRPLPRAAGGAAGVNAQKPRKGLPIDSAAGEGNLHAVEALRRPEGEIRQIGGGALEILGGGGHAGANAVGAGPVVVESALVEVRQGLKGDVVQPLAGLVHGEVVEVRQRQLHEAAGGAGVVYIPSAAASGGLDVDLHRTGEGHAVAVLPGKGHPDHAVEALRRHEGDGIQRLQAEGVAALHRRTPAAAPAAVEGALAGGGRGEADEVHALAGHGGGVIVKIPAVKADIARAVVVVLEPSVQLPGDHDDQLAVVAGACGAVAGVADGHRAHEALGGDEGNLLQVLPAVLLHSGHTGAVVQLALPVPVQHALRGGGQGEDHVAQGGAGLLLADLAEGCGRQGQGLSVGRSEGHVGLGFGDLHLNFPLEGAPVPGGAGEGDDGLLLGVGGVGHEHHVGDIGPLGLAPDVQSLHGAHARAGAVHGLVPQVQRTLGRRDGEAGDGHQGLIPLRLDGLLTQRVQGLLQGGEAQGLADRGGVLGGDDEVVVALHVDGDVGVVDARLDGHHGGARRNRVNGQAAAVIAHGADHVGAVTGNFHRALRRVAIVVDTVVAAGNLGRVGKVDGLVLLEGDFRLHRDDAADGDEEVKLAPGGNPRLGGGDAGDLRVAGGDALHVEGVAVAAGVVDRLGDGLIGGGPDDVVVVVGRDGPAVGVLGADAGAEGGAPLHVQGKGVGLVAGADTGGAVVYGDKNRIRCGGRRGILLVSVLPLQQGGGGQGEGQQQGQQQGQAPPGSGMLHRTRSFSGDGPDGETGAGGCPLPWGCAAIGGSWGLDVRSAGRCRCLLPQFRSPLSE